MSMTDTTTNPEGHDFDNFSPEELAALQANMDGKEFDPETFMPPADGGGTGASDPAGDNNGAGQDGDQQNQGQQQPGAEEPTEDELRDQGVETFTDQKGQRQKRVSFHKFQRLQQAYDDLSGKYNSLETNSAAERARIEERLQIINEALSTPGQQPGRQQDQQQGEDDPKPDIEKDIFAYAKWADKRIGALVDRIDQLENAGRDMQATTELAETYRELSSDFARQQPAFVGGYRHLMSQRMQELSIPHLKFGGADGKTPLPLDPGVRKRISQQIVREEQNLVRKAIDDGVNPAQRLFELAKARGFNPEGYIAAIRAQQAGGGQQQGRQQQQRPGQQQRQPVADPNALDAPIQQRRQQLPARQQQQPMRGANLDTRVGGLDSAGDMIDNINAGQSASRTLSNMGGGGGQGAGMALTPQDLARMSEDDFSALVDRLSEDKLRELLGD